jgi:REP element-mobilizing transposase RayT
MGRPPRIPVWLADGQAITYFITLCVSDRKAVLDNANTFGAIKTFCVENKNWRTIAAVIMPDHVHALIRPHEGRDGRVTQFSAGLKRFVPKQPNANWKWQDGVFDRLLRKNEFTEAKWHYMRENPVRAGLAQRWEDWPYKIGYEEL